MTFKQRLTAPAYDDKNYIKSTYGGYNYCIVINNSTGSCLPNCVGYAWGRWREILGSFHNLSRANAEMWYLNTNDGYKRGQVPKIGAVACWRKGIAGNSQDGAGHVAIVEDIGDDYILVSQSNYGGTRWELKKYYKNENLGYKASNTLTWQGFIYLPINVEIEGKKEETPAKSEKVEGESTLKSDKTLKVGDKVKIVKSGNSQANGKGKPSYGIGWERTILSIYKGAYPYKVGKDGVATGWYSADGLEKL